MPERLHRAALDHAHAAVALRPVGQALHRKLRPPAELARDRREAELEQPARAAFGAEVVDQDDLAAGPGDAHELVERRFRVRHRGDDELRHHDVERAVRQREMLGVHHRQDIDMGELVFGDALDRLAQHRLAQVDADDAVVARVVGQRDAGADADFEDAAAGRAAGLFGGGDRRGAAGREHLAEHGVVNRGPARVGALDARFVDVCPHAVPELNRASRPPRARATAAPSRPTPRRS